MVISLGNYPPNLKGASTMKCVVCGDKAEYVINKTIPLCEACFDTIDETDETGEIIVDELQDESQDG